MEPNCTKGPVTDCSTNDSALGLAVGLPVALITVAVVIAVLYIRRFRSANISQPPELKSPEESVHNADNPRYIASVLTRPPTHQDPVYENFQSRGPVLAQNRQSNTTSTSTHRGDSQAEDLYLQCDPQEDAIYNNDPSFFKCSRQPDDDDEYIMPDMS